MAFEVAFSVALVALAFGFCGAKATSSRVFRRPGNCVVLCCVGDDAHCCWCGRIIKAPETPTVDLVAASNCRLLVDSLARPSSDARRANFIQLGRRVKRPQLATASRPDTEPISLYLAVRIGSLYSNRDYYCRYLAAAIYPTYLAFSAAGKGRRLRNTRWAVRLAQRNKTGQIEARQERERGISQAGRMGRRKSRECRRRN